MQPVSQPLITAPATAAAGLTFFQLVIAESRQEFNRR